MPIKKLLLLFIILVCLGVGLVFLLQRRNENMIDLPDNVVYSDNKIESVSFTDCKVIITTNHGYEWEAGNLSEDCPENPSYAISPSRKYLVFEDVSGGVDLWVRIFSTDTLKVDTLGVWGTSSLFEMLFAPNDELVIYNGYAEIPEEQTVYVYNIPGLYKRYPENLDDYNYFLYGPYSRELDISVLPGDYFSLEQDDTYLYIYGGSKENPILRGQYTLTEIWPDHF